MMIGTTEFHIFILVYGTWTFIQGHRARIETKYFSTNNLATLSIDVGGSLHAVETWWSYESYTHLI